MTSTHIINTADTADNAYHHDQYKYAHRESFYSVVIPVYNSERIVADTIDQTVTFFEAQGWRYEIVLVNDGSSDKSWEVLKAKAAQNPNLVVINLLHNYGQHTAVYCGLMHATGDYVITIDDDLQNPPGEIVHLVNKAITDGNDVVFGKFHQKQHAQHRKWGSWLIMQINRRVFRQPPDLTVTNFRLLRRDVVDRICNYRTGHPYITGLTLMFAHNPANVMAEHHPRREGKSNYNLLRILNLVFRILFNYSSYPLRFVSLLGFAVSLLAILFGIFIFFRAAFNGVNVPGWATIMIVMSFLNGILILSVSMLGEYVIRLVKQVSQVQHFYITEAVNLREHRAGQPDAQPERVDV